MNNNSITTKKLNTELFHGEAEKASVKKLTDLFMEQVPTLSGQGLRLSPPGGGNCGVHLLRLIVRERTGHTMTVEEVRELLHTVLQERATTEPEQHIAEAYTVLKDASDRWLDSNEMALLFGWGPLGPLNLCMLSPAKNPGARKRFQGSVLHYSGTQAQWVFIMLTGGGSHGTRGGDHYELIVQSPSSPGVNCPLSIFFSPQEASFILASTDTETIYEDNYNSGFQFLADFSAEIMMEMWSEQE